MSDKRSTFDRLALGCISYLETFPECRNVAFQGSEPVQSTEVMSWERKNGPCKLPADLKVFYAIFNGFNLTWNIEIGDKIETLGEMRLNKLDTILKTSADFFVQDKLPDEVNAPTAKNCTLFTLDSSCPLGDIVLLYRTGSAAQDDPEVWLLDHSAQLSYLCRNLTHYLRLMVVHLGIRGWQGAFTDSGWSPATQTWMNLFCKERLVIDRHYRSDQFQDKRV